MEEVFSSRESLDPEVSKSCIEGAKNWNSMNPLRISVLDTGHQEQKNKRKNKVNTMKEQ